MPGGWKRREDGGIERTRYWRLVTEYKHTILASALQQNKGDFEDAAYSLELSRGRFRTSCERVDKDCQAEPLLRHKPSLLALSASLQAKAGTRRGKRKTHVQGDSGTAGA